MEMKTMAMARATFFIASHHSFLNNTKVQGGA
jgi:hypothetical protein